MPDPTRPAPTTRQTRRDGEPPAPQTGPDGGTPAPQTGPGGGTPAPQTGPGAYRTQADADVPGDGRRAVVVVGDLVTDVLVVHESDIAVGSDTRAAISVGGGGQAANTAAWLARAGCRVTLIAAVGDDPAGRERTAELTAGGVRCAVQVHAGTPTGSVVVLATAAERTMFTDRGAALRLDPAAVTTAIAAGPVAAHLHLSGYPLLDPASRPAGLAALAAARARGWTISVDAASAAPLLRVGARSFLDWVRPADLLLCNADEAAVLAAGARQLTTSAPPPGAHAAAVTAGAQAAALTAGAQAAALTASAQAAALTASAQAATLTASAQAATLTAGAQAAVLTAVVRNVVVKRGAAGAVWCDAAGRMWSVPGTEVTVIDPTGAGDAFAAGLIAAWVGGALPDVALATGSHLGATAVSQPGARPRP